MSQALSPAVELLASFGEEPPLLLGPPSGQRWWTLAEATACAGEWFTELAEREGDRRVAAAYLSSWLARAPMLVVGLPAVLTGVAPRTRPHRVWLHRHPDGWFDRHAVDPTGEMTGAVDDVLLAAGAHVADLAAPVVDALCAALPIGRPAVWGGVADALGGYALMLGRALGRDAPETWRRCETLVDGVQQHVPALRHRPRPFPVTWSGGTAHFQVRGTCCLYHRTCDRPDPDGEGYCSTCPLRTDDSRTRRLRHHLETST